MEVILFLDWVVLRELQCGGKQQVKELGFWLIWHVPTSEFSHELFCWQVTVVCGLLCWLENLWKSLECRCIYAHVNWTLVFLHTISNCL